jgi:hypothetical protein
MSLITFTCAAPVASWTPSVNPKYGSGYAQEEKHFQPKGFAGSDFYSYDHGHTHGRILEWAMLPAADMTTLLTFLGLVHGGVHTFSFKDYDGTTFATSRILNFQNIQFQHRLLLYYEVSLELEVA